jgi:hypothetical protein
VVFTHPDNLCFGEMAFLHLVCSLTSRRLHIRLRDLPRGRP